MAYVECICTCSFSANVRICTVHVCSILHSMYMYAVVKMAGVEKGGGGGDGGVEMTPADREKLGEMMVFPTKDVPPKMKKGLKVSCIHSYTVYVYAMA